MSIDSEFGIRNFQFKSLFQTSIWANFKARHGWLAHQVDDQFLLERTLPFGQVLLYAPELPFSSRSLPKFVTKINNLGRQRNAFVVRLEFLTEWNETSAARLRQLGLKKSFEEVQPEFRQWIDLDPDEATILAQMKQKGRYNIRVAERHAIKVTSEIDPNIFLKLFRDTARRDGFSIRADHYYVDLMKTLESNHLGELRVAWQNKTPLAALIVSYFDGLASYLYGASSSEKRELMAPYLLHWETMKEAKRRGCHTYDLLAIAPFGENHSEFGIRNSELQTKFVGITRFKQQFGGRPVHLLGSWDLVLNPLVYQTFRWLEHIRRR